MEYPTHLEWNGQHQGMEYLESQIHLLDNIIHGVLYKIHQKEMETEKGLDLLWEASTLLTEIKTDLAWHSDGESREREQGDGTWKESYLMEAYYIRNTGYMDNHYNQLTELYNKVYPKTE